MQAGGQEFESPYLHLIVPKRNIKQYLENYTLKEIEDIKYKIFEGKEFNFTDCLESIRKQTRTKRFIKTNRADVYANTLEQKVKRIRAQGGCLGTKSRRKT